MRILHVLAVLAACSGGGSIQTTLTISPKTATVEAGGPPITFTATASGDVATIQWTLDGAGQLQGADTTATFTPPDSAGTSTTATVRAEMNEAEDTATVTILPHPPVLLTGRVVSAQGRPLAGARVIVPGSGDAITDGTGAFAIANVVPPYEAYATIVDTAGLHVTYYPKLHSLTPTMSIAVWGCAATGSTTISGTITGPGFPQPADRRTHLAFAAQSMFDLDASADLSTYDMSLAWCDPAVVAGEVHALQWQVDAAGYPAAYTAYGKNLDATIKMNAANHADIVTSALVPSGTTHLSGTITSGGAPITAPVMLRARAIIGYAGSARLQLVNLPASAVELNTPTLANSIEVLASKGDPPDTWSGAITRAAPSATNIVLDVPYPPAPDSPVDGANVRLATQRFQWFSIANKAVYVLSVRVPSEAIDIVTIERNAPLPDPAAFGGTPWPTGMQSGNWRVFGTTAIEEVDDAVTADGWLSVGLPVIDNYQTVGWADWFAPRASYVFSRSYSRGFHAAP